VVQPGEVEVAVDTTEPVTFWIDEEQHDSAKRAEALLTPGVHRITVRLAAGSSASGALRVEVRKAPRSSAQVEVIHGDTGG
jgi:hypothetical protein